MVRAPLLHFGRSAPLSCIPNLAFHPRVAFHSFSENCLQERSVYMCQIAYFIARRAAEGGGPWQNACFQKSTPRRYTNCLTPHDKPTRGCENMRPAFSFRRLQLSRAPLAINPVMRGPVSSNNHCKPKLNCLRPWAPLHQLPVGSMGHTEADMLHYIISCFLCFAPQTRSSLCKKWSVLVANVLSIYHI